MNNLWQLLAQIEKDAKEVARLTNLSPLEYLQELTNGEPTIRELNLQEMTGLPVKIKHD